MSNATQVSKRSSSQLIAIREYEPTLAPLKPERDHAGGDYPRWLDAVHRAAPELVNHARKAVR